MGAGEVTPMKRALILFAILLISCVTGPESVPGCMDSQACNYDPFATIDNDSCEYLGCIDI
tara:strand:+ start:370 stop:552 length:183 start_codon:yes stop_codon:yes gene_type:complete